MPPGGFLRGATIAALLVAISSLLPGVPAAQAQAPGSTRLELVTVHGGAAFHRWSDDNGASWSSWTSLGAPSRLTLQGTPAVVSDGVGRLNVIADSDNGFWQNTFNNGSWSGWFRIPGQSNTGIICVQNFLCFTLLSSPAVASWGPGRMELFVNGSGTDGSISLLHLWGDNYSWSGSWQRLGTGLMQGAPAAVSWGLGRTDVFVRGGGNELVHKWFENGQWSGWENLGGILTTPPAVASPGSGRLNIFTRGTDGQWWGKWFVGAWSDWSATPDACCLDGDVTNSVAATSQAPLTLDVFVIGANPAGALWRKAYNDYAGGWAAWQALDWSCCGGFGGGSGPFTNIAATAWVPVAPSSGGLGGGPSPPACGPATGRPCPLPP
jgi:hypothetical protein